MENYFHGQVFENCFCVLATTLRDIVINTLKIKANTILTIPSNSLLSKNTKTIV